MTWSIPFQQPSPNQSEGNLPLESSKEKVENPANPEASARTGQFLLQLLKAGGGSGDQKLASENVALHGEEEQHQISWHVHDPAVAAMGPSYTFAPTPSAVGGSMPPYLAQSLEMGWSHPFHPEGLPFSSRETVFQTPQENFFPSAFPKGLDLHGQSPVGFEVQSNFDPCPIPVLRDGSRYHSASLTPLSDQASGFRAPPVLERRFSTGWKGFADNQICETLDGAVANPLIGNSAIQTHNGLLAHQQFYGNGAELLRLLQGNATEKTHGLTSDHSCPTELLGGVVDADNNATNCVQKGSVSKIPAPIGPPRRSSHSPPKSPVGILGRLWATAPSPQTSECVIHHQPKLRSSLQNPEDSVARPALNISLNDATFKKERNVIAEKPLGSLCRSRSSNIGDAFSSQGDMDPGWVTFLSLKDSSSHGTGHPQHERESCNSSDHQPQTVRCSKSFGPPQEEQPYTTSLERFKGFQHYSCLNVSFSQGSNSIDSGKVPLKESDAELLSENSREDGRGGGRRRMQSRGQRRKAGSKGTGGQWVAVSERPKTRTVDTDVRVNELQVEEKHEFQVSKPTNRSPSKVDDDKRHKQRQHEWRLKQPALVFSLQHKISAKSNENSCSTLLGENELLSAKSSDDSGLLPHTAQIEHPGLPAASLDDSPLDVSWQGSVNPLLGGRKLVRWESTPYEQDGINIQCLQGEEQEATEEILGNDEQEELMKRVANYLELEDDHELQDYSQNNSELTGQLIVKEPEALVGQSKSGERRRSKLRSSTVHIRKVIRRVNLEFFTTQLLEIYESLIPSAEEEMRRKKFFSKLDDVVRKKWPGAELFLFGSCANAFGVCNSDIDVCLRVEDKQMSKAELVTKMADILKADDMQNVQALTHARVPIVKFTDPATGISCDICVNNMLAVVNSKLLHDYSKEMQPTYCVKIGKVECLYFDQVESICHFGSRNKESLGELVASFFEYWAFQHDYNHLVISVRTGGFISKDEKDWTRRIGNERHLICIEDPFEISHDLGRVVDKHSIRVLRDEFYRAANIMRHDCNPAAILFEPFVRDKS